MKYRQFILMLWLGVQWFGVGAQWRMASLNDDSRITIKAIGTPESHFTDPDRSSVEIRLRDGYPLVFAADPTFKNFRNVTLADLDGDERDEIIFGVADRLFVYRGDSLWWSQNLSGLARFPASIGDLENDGIKDIIIPTGFNQDPGQLYAFNSRGVVKPGWPQSFNGRWMISSAALEDVDADGKMEIVCSDLESGLGSTYLLRYDGTSYSTDWPVTLPNVPAVTPSIGDIDGDGSPDIVINSTREIYAFNLQGSVKKGWPFGNGLTKFSFQSPILADLDGDGLREIITEGHGDLPLYIVMQSDGLPRPGWPRPVPQGQWTYHTPTVIDYQGAPLILTGRPISDGTAKPMLFAWREDGSLLDGFPIIKSGGLEGLITVADIDGDNDPEIIFPSNMIDSLGYGFIHAYKLDGSGELPGFPLRPYGWTYLNGATLGDVDGNGLLDMAVLTYTENEGSSHDSTLLYVYEVNAPADSSHVLWSTYKGNNQRNGFIEQKISTGSKSITSFNFKAYPNPARNYITVDTDRLIKQIQICDINGRILKIFTNIKNRQVIGIADVTRGIYLLHVTTLNDGEIINKIFIE